MFTHTKEEGRDREGVVVTVECFAVHASCRGVLFLFQAAESILGGRKGGVQKV
jgi:hypothetical protein